MLRVMVTGLMLSILAACQLPPSSFGISECAAIPGNSARLECYDRVARQENQESIVQQSSHSAGTGLWRIRTQVNPLDDSDTVTLALNSVYGTNRFGEAVTMTAVCRSNVTSFYIDWKTYLGRENTVRIRIGDGEPSSARWELSPDRRTTERPRPIPMLRQMFLSDSFVAEITPYFENPIIVIFDTTGMEAAFEPLRRACNWL